MTVDKSRFAAELELPPEAEEMMAKITELSGCAGVVIPEEATRRLKETCESKGTTSPRVFPYIMDGVLTAIETSVAGIFIQLWPLEDPGPADEPGSEQVNGKIRSWKEIPQFEFRQFRQSQMSRNVPSWDISQRLRLAPVVRVWKRSPLLCDCGCIIGL